MKKLFILLLLAAILCASAALAEENGILGQPFPDFSVTDCQGNAFSLSGALQDHDAVLINIWATWCPPCAREFPYLQKAYEAYSDRVAFIALSCEAGDTDAAIRDFSAEKGVTFSMASDISTNLASYLNIVSIPTTVVVDRFGNAAFLHVGSFMDAGEVQRVLKTFVGEGYAQTTVLTDIPEDTATALYPVSSALGLSVKNTSAQRLMLTATGEPLDMIVYVVNGDTAHVKLDITAADDPTQMYYYDGTDESVHALSSLRLADGSAYRYDQAMPTAAEGYSYTAGFLLDYSSDENVEELPVYLISNEDGIESFMQDVRAYVAADAAWAYAEEDAPTAGNAAYVVRVVDQNGDPVPKANVNFCTDDFCAIQMSDENGVITYDGATDFYHLSILSVPEGYAFDRDADLALPAEYGEWLLRVRKEP